MQAVPLQPISASAFLVLAQVKSKSRVAQTLQRALSQGRGTLSRSHSQSALDAVPAAAHEEPTAPRIAGTHIASSQTSPTGNGPVERRIPQQVSVHVASLEGGAVSRQAAGHVQQPAARSQDWGTGLRARDRQVSWSPGRAKLPEAAEVPGNVWAADCVAALGFGQGSPKLQSR